LCEACAEWASTTGCNELSLTVVVGNTSAHQAYEAAGFAVRGETTWARDDGRTLDEFVMVRTLG
jgi:hypothetical protein